MLLVSGVLQAAGLKVPAYSTSQQCQSCHEAEYKTWSDSHHSWAWRSPTADNVLADFNDTSFEHAGFTYRFVTEGDRYFVIADNALGESQKYQVHSVAGVTPLQQYLVETERGRLQALDVSWDTLQKRWYHLYPGIDTSAGNGLHWTGPYKNWNARCVECHVTGFEKNYNLRTDTYSSRQAEMGVGCEACHGPGEAHVSWAKQPDSFDPDIWHNVGQSGLLSAYRPGDAASQINLCAACHSRREPLGADSPPEGAPFTDHYKLSLLRDELYFPDGQIKEEVYVYGSFLQSKMYASGVQCSNCHNPHSNELIAQGNAICTQCHNPQGRPEFPSLTKANYDSPEHHFHEVGSEAAACVSCHMPDRNYMVVDPRRDHSFRVPDPLLSEKTGSPDVCTSCHQGNSYEWAATSIRQYFTEAEADNPHFSEVFAAVGAVAAQQSVRGLIAIASDKTQADIVRASALERCTTLPHNLSAADLKPFAADESALVRMTAARLLRDTAADPERQSIVMPLLRDPAKSVRIETAKLMLGTPPDQLSSRDRSALQSAIREFQESMIAKSDYPEGQMVLGGVALSLKNYPAAIQAFERATAMDPQLLQAWSILIRMKQALGDAGGARTALVTALQNNPDSYELEELANSMGMQLRRNN